MINSTLTVILDIDFKEEILQKFFKHFKDEAQKVQLTFLLKWKQFGWTESLLWASMTTENTPIPDSFMVWSFFTPPEVPYKSVLNIDDFGFEGSVSKFVNFEYDLDKSKKR